MTGIQSPLGSGFGPASTAAEVARGIDLTGRVAVVTGGASGIGLETIRALAAAGARVIVPARSPGRAAAALEGVAGVEVAPMDLAHPASVDAFAAEVVASGRPVHLLVNNAGIMATPLARDARGYESQLATNHLGHFQLTARLWRALVRAEGARVVSVSSWGHRFSPFVFDDPHFQRRAYDRWLAYGQSKTANILFAVALDARGREHGVRAFSLHPGSIVDTALARHLTPDELRATGVLDADGRPLRDPARGLKTAAQGAATSVWCATSPLLDGRGGLYCENADVAPLVPEEERPGVTGAPGAGPRRRSMGVLPYAIDPAAAERLWEASEEMIRAEV